MILQFENTLTDNSALEDAEVMIVYGDEKFKQTTILKCDNPLAHLTRTDDGLYDSRRIHDRRIIAGGVIDGHQWYIVSYGSYPCAYVKSDVPEKKQDDILVHGSITFAGKAFKEFPVDGDYIGWDYNHFEDYSCKPYCVGGKVWTLDEIMDDVRSVIAQLVEMGW